MGGVMAGQGPAPKLPEQRAGHIVPKRGEWQDLPPLVAPVLPALEGEWPDRTLALWDAWRADWVTGCFGSAEIAMSVELASLHREALADPKNSVTRWAEIRQWMDRLGFTMKGKRDLRLRLAEKPVVEVSKSKKRSASLHLVDATDDAVSA